MRVKILRAHKSESEPLRTQFERGFATYCEDFDQDAEIIISREQAETLMNWICESLYGVRINPAPRE